MLGHVVDAWAWTAAPSAVITTDASPWGLGGTLWIQGRAEAYFADALVEEDFSQLGFERGSCSGQAAAEALAVLVALRLWFPLWRGQRLALTVRSDSEAALGALGKLGSPAPAVNKVAREVALDVALSYYGVDTWTHVAAADNKGADELSRWSQPGVIPTVPPSLRQARRDHTASRTASWWTVSSAEWRLRRGAARRAGAGDDAGAA